MADLKKRRSSLVNSILGRDAAPRSVVLAGMADLEAMLDRRFRELNRQRAQVARAQAPMRDKLIGPLRKDPAAAESVSRMRALQKSARSRRLSPPQVEQHKERVFLGSLGATRVPPFDYPWTWNATTGSPSVTTSAKVNTGQINLNISTDDNNSSSINARAALGIFFQSPIDCLSHFKFWSNPALRYLWWDYCTLDAAHTDGFIGLYAASYDLSGGLTGTPVDQTISLWSDDSYWNGGDGNGSNSGYPLSANFEVDNSHWYALWVWCGVNASAAGFGTFSGSGSGGILSVTVPSISWEVG